MAKKKAEALARERAVSSYAVWVESSTKVKNFQLQEDLIQTISAGMLRNVSIDDEIWKGREICITLSADITPQDIVTEEWYKFLVSSRWVLSNYGGNEIVRWFPKNGAATPRTGTRTAEL